MRGEHIIVSLTRRTQQCLVALLIAALSSPPLALAQPAPPPEAPKEAPKEEAKEAPKEEAKEEAAPPAGEEEPKVDESKKEEAKAHFLKGLSLLQEEAWAAALAEFLVSRDLYPTRAATNNAAIALRKLQRFDEALDMFETLLREFPTMPAGERTLAQRAVAELRELVGTIEIVGAEPGAAIVVSGQNRGEYPPVVPLRVTAGTHLVRISKEGFEPFETRVDVAGGQTARVEAKLRVLKKSGRLKVREQAGKTLEVVVDNVTVGQTPWEGVVGVGDHTVMLRGKDKMGSAPAAAPVKAQQLTSITLLAEELDASMRVDPTPVGATVAIDSVPVGRGAWLGRLKSGTHRVDVKLDGFVPVTKQVKLERGGREIVAVTLEQDPEAERWRKPSKFTFDVGASFAMMPSLGGDVASRCQGDCTSSLGMGALGLFHAGYQLGSGFGFGVTLGYLIAVQNTQGREATLTPNGYEASAALSGTLNESMRLSAFVGGATASYHMGERFPLLFRFGAGVMTGELRDERSGTFRSSTGASFDTYPVSDFPKATYLYIDPEVRIGWRPSEHWEVGASVQAMVLFGLSQPTWSDQIELAAGPVDGIGRYPADALIGPFTVLIAPGFAARYDF